MKVIFLDKMVWLVAHLEYSNEIEVNMLLCIKNCSISVVWYIVIVNNFFHQSMLVYVHRQGRNLKMVDVLKKLRWHIGRDLKIRIWLYTNNLLLFICPFLPIWINHCYWLRLEFTLFYCSHNTWRGYWMLWLWLDLIVYYHPFFYFLFLFFLEFSFLGLGR